MAVLVSSSFHTSTFFKKKKEREREREREKKRVGEAYRIGCAFNG